jgi:hypothetical protein
MKLKLTWDGSDLGDITKYYIDIKNPEENKSGAVLKLRTKYGDIKCFAWKYSNDIPLIIDELKPIFGLPKIGRHKCSIEGINMLIARRENKLENVLEPGQGDIDDIRRCIVFRHLFGIITYGDCLWYRPGTGIISYKELTVDFNKKGSKISKTNITKWFRGDYGLVNSITLEMLKSTNKEDYTLTKLAQLTRCRINTVINRINKDMIAISSGFMSRIQTHLSHSVSENAM